MTPWNIGVSCPQCGNVLDYINATSNGLLAISLASCLHCVKQYELTVRIKPLPWTVDENRTRMRARQRSVA